MAPVDAAPDVTPAPSRAPAAEPRARWAAVAVWAALAIPLVVAAAVLWSPRWYPVGDMAWTELRVRDVTSDHPPLVGLAGRIGSLQDPGSHPGPASFWALYPSYAATGESANGLLLGGALLGIVAAGLAVWLLSRRGGVAVVLGGGAILAVLYRFYTADLLAVPWNPYLPVAWYLLLVVAAWSISCGDEKAIPVAVLAASMCVQTHISYVGIGLGLAGVSLVAALVVLRSRWPDAEARRRTLVWLGVGAAVGVVMWIPPVVQQLTEDRGNLTTIWRYFTDSPEEPISLGTAGRVWIQQLDPSRLLRSTASPNDVGWSTRPLRWPGALLLLTWLASVAVVAVRWRRGVADPRLVRLQGTAAVVLALGFISMSRIFGIVWYYLILWGWAQPALLLAAIGATVAEVVRSNRPPEGRARLARVGLAGLAVVLVAASLAFTYHSAKVDRPFPPMSDQIEAALEPALVALRADDVPGGGEDGRYLVTWNDPIAIGSQGWALLNELERDGFDVGVPPSFSTGAPYRGLEPGEYTGEVHLEVGPGIEQWRLREGVRELSYHDPRTPAQQREFQLVTARLVAELEGLGLYDVVEQMATNIFTASLDTRIPPDVHKGFVRLLELGLPIAVFAAPA